MEERGVIKRGHREDTVNEKDFRVKQLKEMKHDRLKERRRK